VEIISSIPDCHQDLYIRDRPCITFIYTPNSSAVVDGIITRIKANNQPPIANHKVSVGCLAFFNLIKPAPGDAFREQQQQQQQQRLQQ
jgi:hypothetical protein